MMRKERDGESTKQQVIAAAKQVFAERGFNGASLAMISDRAGISTGLILHHFQNKDTLYRNVLENLAGDYSNAIAGAMSSAAWSPAALQEMLRAAFEYWSRDDAYLKISEWSHLENRSELVDAEARLTLGLADMVGRLQAEGKVDPRFSAFVLLTMTIGPIHFWMRNRDFFRATMKLGLSAEELDELFLNQFTVLIQKLYRPDEDRTQPPALEKG